jgi:nucleotide-binding universal stress UspA family protein
MSFSAFVLGLLACNLIFGAAGAYLANRWGRDPFVWLLFGSILGPIGFVTLLALRRQDRTQMRRPWLPAQQGASDTAARRGPKILLATDGSPSSTKAAEQLVERFGGAPGLVTLLYVLPMERAGDSSSPAGSERLERLQATIEEGCSVARKVLASGGIACEVVTRFGEPAEEILRMAQEGGFDWLVVGRRGLGRAGKLLLGSVSDKVVKAAACPVIVAG